MGWMALAVKVLKLWWILGSGVGESSFKNQGSNQELLMGDLTVVGLIWNNALKIEMVGNQLYSFRFAVRGTVILVVVCGGVLTIFP